MDFHSRLDAGRDAELLGIAALANSGDRKAIQKKFNELLKMI